MDNESPNQEIYKDEYKLVFEGCKFFVSLRFITAAFAMSINSALLTLYGQAINESKLFEVAVFGIAIIFWVGLLIVEIRTTSIFHSFLERGNVLEFQLGNPNGFFHSITELSVTSGLWSFVRHRWGIRLVYAGMFVLWAMLLVATIVRFPKL